MLFERCSSQDLGHQVEEQEVGSRVPSDDLIENILWKKDNYDLIGPRPLCFELATAVFSILRARPEGKMWKSSAFSIWKRLVPRLCFNRQKGVLDPQGYPRIQGHCLVITDNVHACAPPKTKFFNPFVSPSEKEETLCCYCRRMKNRFEVWAVLLYPYQISATDAFRGHRLSILDSVQENGMKLNKIRMRYKKINSG